MLQTYPDIVGVDVYDEPSPVILKMPIYVLNIYDIKLYPKIYAEVPNANWGVGGINDTTGIDSNASKTYTLEILRTRPLEAVLSEEVTFIIQFYKDPTFTDLLTEYRFTTVFDFINRGLLSVVDEDTFEEGWENWMTQTIDGEIWWQLIPSGINDSYCLSAKVMSGRAHGRLYKTFDLRGYTKAWFEVHMKATPKVSGEIIFIDTAEGKEVKKYPLLPGREYRKYVYRIPDQLVDSFCVVEFRFTLEDIEGGIFYMDDVRVIAI